MPSEVSQVRSMSPPTCTNPSLHSYLHASLVQVRSTVGERLESETTANTPGERRDTWKCTQRYATYWK